MQYSKIERAAAVRKRLIQILVYSFLTVWGILVLFPFLLDDPFFREKLQHLQF